jgi:hypothetical protein
MKGYKEWKNKNNGFTCIQLHYTADPNKRSKEWRKSAEFGMDAKAWATEMELSWETYAGEPVYGREFTQEMHVLNSRYEPDSYYPFLIRGWDFGGNHSCVVAQYMRGVLYVIDEYPNMGYNTRRIAREVAEDCNLKYGNEFNYVDVIDPSGMWEGKTSDGKACGDVMRELGMELCPGVQDVSRRIDSVMKLLVSLKEGKPCLRVNPSCNMLIKGFLGGYHYPEKETKNQKHNKPVKDEYSHIHDALQYVCTRVNDVGDAYYGEVSVDDLGGLKYDL